MQAIFSQVSRASRALSGDHVPASRRATLEQVGADWSATLRRAERVLEAPAGSLSGLEAPRTILGSSKKTQKAGTAEGALVAVAYLAPGSMLSRVAGGSLESTLCPMATLNGCESACLGGDLGRGQLSMPRGSARRAQLGRTALLLGSPMAFGALLRHDLESLSRRSRAAGLPAFVRMDGTSDVGIATQSAFRDVLESLELSSYDYTKMPGRALNSSGGHVVTFSGSPRNLRAARMVLERGGRVAVVVAARSGEHVERAESLEILRELVSGTGARMVDGDASEPLEDRGPELRILSAKIGKSEGWDAISGFAF